MELLHVENYPGTNGEDFKIRIFDNNINKETVINLMIEDNGVENEINIRRDIHEPDVELKSLIEYAKKAIVGITILRRY